MLSKLPLIEKSLFLLIILFLPTQLGKHFWPEFSIVNGIRVDYLSPTLYFTDILIVLLFSTWRVHALRKKQKSGLLKKLGIRIYILFVVFLCGNILLSGNYLGGFYSLVKFLEMSFIAFYVASHVGKTVSITQVTLVLAVGVITQSVVAIAQFSQQGSLGGLFYFLGERTFTASTPGIANASLNGELVMRAYGTFPHPNVLAGYLVISMLLLFFYLFPEKKRQLRLLAVGALLIGTIALLLTLSRSAIVLWVFFLVIVFIFQLVKLRASKELFSKLFVFGAAAIVVWLIFSQLLAPRFFETNLFEEALVQRQILSEVAVSMFLSNPLFGVGLGNFLPVLATLQSPLSLGLYLQPVHNIFLLVAAELGIIGFSFFTWFIGMTAIRLVRSQKAKNNSPILLCLLVIVITGMTDHYWLTLQQGQLLFALVIGLSWMAAVKLQ